MEEAQYEGSSNGRSEGHAAEEAAGVEALYAAAIEAQEGDEIEGEWQPEEEWLAMGPQAPEPAWTSTLAGGLAGEQWPLFPRPSPRG